MSLKELLHLGKSKKNQKLDIDKDSIRNNLEKYQKIISY